MASPVRSGDTTVYDLRPVRKPSLGISSLLKERKRMSKKKHRNLDDSKEFQRGITEDFIETLKEDNKNLVDTLRKDREFMDKTFTEERNANQTKFKTMVTEIGRVDKSQVKLTAEFGIAKWLIGLLVIAVVTQLLSMLFGG